MSKINENQAGFSSVSKKKGGKPIFFLCLTLAKASELCLARQSYKSFPLNSAHLWLHSDRQLRDKRPVCDFALADFLKLFFSFPCSPGKRLVWWKGTLHWPEECCTFSWGFGSKGLPRDLRVFWAHLLSETWLHTPRYWDFCWRNFFLVFVGISQEDPILVWKTGWEARNEYSRAPGGWQSGLVPWLGGESSQGTWGGVRGFHLWKGCPEVSLNSLLGQMSFLDWSLKDLGVPEVCCALQCFLLEGFGGRKVWFIFVTREFPAVHLWGLETREWWQVYLDEEGGGEGMRPLGLDSKDHACMFQSQNSANPMLNLWNQRDLEGNIKDGKKRWIHFSSNWIWNTIQRQQHWIGRRALIPWCQVWLQGGAVCLCLYSMFIMYLMSSGFAFN